MKIYDSVKHSDGWLWWMSVPDLVNEYDSMHSDIDVSLGLDVNLILTHVVQKNSASDGEEASA
jgi:hypothetical protein